MEEQPGFANDTDKKESGVMGQQSPRGSEDNPTTSQELPLASDDEKDGDDGTDGGGSTEEGFPPSSEYPAPDDASGNPWSILSVLAIMTLQEVAQFMTVVAPDPGLKSIRSHKLMWMGKLTVFTA